METSLGMAKVIAQETQFTDQTFKILEVKAQRWKGKVSRTWYRLDTPVHPRWFTHNEIEVTANFIEDETTG